MHVLHVLEYSPPFAGGIVLHLSALGRYLEARGHRLIAGFPMRRDWFEELAPGCAPLVIPSIRRPLRSGFAGDLGRLCVEHSVRVIHLHFSFALPVALAWASFDRRIPVIYHWHNPPKALQGDASTWRRTLAGAIARTTDRRALNHHIVVSRQIRELICARRWTDSGRVSLVPNALALPRRPDAPGMGRGDRPKELPPASSGSDGQEAGSFVIGAVANFRPQKDHHTLLAAFAQVRQKHRGARLVLVGDGETRPAIEHLASALGIRGSVEFMGYVPDMAAVYPRFDLFALSSHYEGQGLVLLEAMGYGLPIVATDLEPIRDTLGALFHPYLVAPRDVPALAGAIGRLIESPAERKAAGVAGRNRVRSEFDLDTWCGRVLEIYDRLWSSSPESG